MAEVLKFISKMDAAVLDALREYAREQNRTLSGVLTEAARNYLDQVRVRPVFRDAAAEVLREHDELLERLAK